MSSTFQQTRSSSICSANSYDKRITTSERCYEVVPACGGTLNTAKKRGLSLLGVLFFAVLSLVHLYTHHVVDGSVSEYVETSVMEELAYLWDVSFWAYNICSSRLLD